MHKKIIFIFSLIGFLFSGYMTFSDIVLGYCPMKEGCPLIFGYPACLYGFALFLMLLITSIFLLNKESKRHIQIIFWISLVGVLFAAYSSVIEIFFTKCIGKCEYTMILPTCIYGLIMYLVIFIKSAFEMKICCNKPKKTKK